MIKSTHKTLPIPSFSNACIYYFTDFSDIVPIKTTQIDGKTTNFYEINGKIKAVYPQRRTFL